MKKHRILALVICLIAIGIFFYILGDDSLKIGPVTAVQVEVDEGKVVVENQTGSRTVTPDEPFAMQTNKIIAAAPRSPTAIPVPTPTIAREFPPVPGQLHINITDAMGDPIQSGNIQINEKNYGFVDGHLEIPELSAGIHALAASAEGYESATKTIEIPETRETTITLEYLCSFEVLVESGKEKGGSPVEGAEVLIWKGPSVQRPVGRMTTLKSPMSYDIGDTNEIRVQWEQNGLRVVGVSGYREQGYKSEPGEVIKPLPGDLIVGISGRMWRQGDRTGISPVSALHFAPPGKSIESRLRVWDAIEAHAAFSGKESASSDYVEVERDGERVYFDTWRIDSSHRGELVARRTTDSMGRCSFENLPAGIYYAQARKETTRSMVAVIHPAYTGMRFWMISEKENFVMVFVRRSGVKSRSRADIPGVNVQLISRGETEGKGIYVANTGWDGIARLKSIPWGDYTLTVTPPSKLSASPPSKNIEVSVEEASTRFAVEFEVEEGYTISGTVVRADTKEPVPGFSLALILMREYGLKDVYDTTKSDNSGRFVFLHVLPGEYEINAYALNPSEYTGFLPPNKAPHAPDLQPIRQTCAVTVKDEDVHGVEKLVLPGVRTRFTGQVLTSEGSPVAGAFLSFGKGQGGLLESGDRSGEDGRFDLSILWPQDTRKYKMELEAYVMTHPETQILEDGSSYTPMPRVIAKGSRQIKFRIGDTVSDIRIVLEPVAEGATLVGTITTEDGVWPVPVNLYAVQGGNILHPQLLSDGSYRINFIQPGPFGLNVFPKQRRPGEPGGGAFPPERSYRAACLELEMPLDKETLTVDVTLKIGSYLTGKIIDEQRQPISFARVNAESSESSGLAVTDENGVFWIGGVCPEQPHNIKVTLNRKKEPSAHLENISPPAENIVIMIKTPE
ncbi:MAG: hypothetical protein ABIH23_33150 [bacterium]